MLTFYHWMCYNRGLVNSHMALFQIEVYSSGYDGQQATWRLRGTTKTLCECLSTLPTLTGSKALVSSGADRVYSLYFMSVKTVPA